MLSNKVKSLKNNYLAQKPSIQINRALAFTEVFEKYPEMDKSLLRAKGFRKACQTAPILIQAQELIVGHPCGRPRAGSFSPDVAWEWLVDEIDEIGVRAQDPYEISEENKEIILNKIAPVWKGHSLAEKCETKLRGEGLWEFGAEACISDLTYHVMNGGGDSSPDYARVVMQKGIIGLKKEIETKLTKTNYLDENKKNFYLASLEVCQGIIEYSQRVSDEAVTLAGCEKDEKRKNELLTISEINKNVPANPPQSFYEALQAIWTIQSLFLLEENQCSTSLGRIDQYLYPFYRHDIDAGILTVDQAKELFACFMIKCSEMIWYTPGATATYFAGYMPYINMTVGGVKADNEDGVNELTYVIMDVVADVKLYQPTLACRVHNQSPSEYLNKIVDVINAGAGMPAVHFDDAHIKMMLSKGANIQQARDYSLMGCVEPQISGQMHQWTAGGFTQYPMSLELLFNNGKLNSYSTEKIWTSDIELDKLDTFEKFDYALKERLDFVIDNNCKATNLIQDEFRKHNPTPYMSLFIEGCIESGLDVTNGGAKLYAGPGTIFAGLSTYADSVNAVKELVYDKRKYTLYDIKEALNNNWQGYEIIRLDCQNASKFGNDIEQVDQITADILDYTEAKMNSYDSLFAHHIHGTLSQSFNTPLGEMIGATPDGREANTCLSDGMSPNQGYDTNGITAVVKSVSKLNVESMSLGMAHNFKISPNLLSNKEGKEALASVIRTASLLGNGQMQFNCVTNETLIDAQNNPEKYRDLIVRVAGYSAFFVELCESVQNEIITRNEVVDV